MVTIIKSKYTGGQGGFFLSFFLSFFFCIRPCFFLMCVYSTKTPATLAVPAVFLSVQIDMCICAVFQSRFCSKLGLPSSVQKAATHIARKAVEMDLVPG